MLAHRLRRWANISPPLVQRIVFAISVSPVCLGEILIINDGKKEFRSSLMPIVEISRLLGLCFSRMTQIT